jgi:hypothetical protein
MEMADDLISYISFYKIDVEEEKAMEFISL